MQFWNFGIHANLWECWANDVGNDTSHMKKPMVTKTDYREVTVQCAEMTYTLSA